MPRPAPRARPCHTRPLALCAGLLLLSARIGAQCEPSWESGVFPEPGFSGEVSCMVEFDDGSGPALIVAGQFQRAAGAVVNSIARWDGTRWAPLGSGIFFNASHGLVSALCVFDDGGGPALYAGGYFTSAGGVSAASIARWDGNSWSALGSGVSSGFAPDVRALAVYDGALYAGGYFGRAGGLVANRIARWNGTSWSSVGSGVGGVTFPSVQTLAVFDDGSGPRLAAGGSFASAGGVPVDHLARGTAAPGRRSPARGGVSPASTTSSCSTRAPARTCTRPARSSRAGARPSSA